MDYQTRQKGPNDIYRTPANAYAFKPSAPLYEEHSPIIAQAYPYRQEEKIKY